MRSVYKKSKLVYGVGVNNADYVTEKKEIIDGKRKYVWFCSFYRAWKDMLQRCYTAKHPAYAGCTVSPEWLIFSNFKIWMEAQNWLGMELDKDILIPGNKLYSSESCAFVSRQLNVFLTGSGNARGDYLIGVCWDKKSRKFRARCCNPFSKTQEYLGLFDTELEAHLAWKVKKHELSCQYADMQTDIRIAEALRARFQTGGK